MRQEVWSRDDLRALLSGFVGSKARSVPPPSGEYLIGYLAAVADLCTATSIEVKGVIPDGMGEYCAGCAGYLPTMQLQAGVSEQVPKRRAGVVRG